ncbi:PH domain-containing protein [Tessaracoccus coleopterorum]|uniref:PH domain-containing protein n=1 Tax=Tessaracoccus coleopterorum TaxID=2714950 RepID=UPI001E61677A|nr:PH domain-containing protein [Tessaracoccus coleopterorum]
MDRFVITNMRVFRVHGVFNTHLATMPMSRILDISMARPLAGQLCGYGHFVFESAAQDQGLRDIRYVGRPEERDLTIQRVIQLSGLRQTMQLERWTTGEPDDEDGT